MREILFRGQTWRFGERVWMNGEKVPSNWVYGGIFQGVGDFSVIYGADKENFTGADIGKHTVYTDTVGQYTGLTDKNGKKIFEGDIVKSVFTQRPYVVCFGEYTHTDEYGDEQSACGWYNTERGGYVTEFGSPGAWAIVIGNIHDNPGLLEELSE